MKGERAGDGYQIALFPCFSITHPLSPKSCGAANESARSAGLGRDTRKRVFRFLIFVEILVARNRRP